MGKRSEKCVQAIWYFSLFFRRKTSKVIAKWFVCWNSHKTYIVNKIIEIIGSYFLIDVIICYYKIEILPINKFKRFIRKRRRNMIYLIIIIISFFRYVCFNSGNLIQAFVVTSDDFSGDLCDFLWRAVLVFNMLTNENSKTFDLWSFE